MVMIMIGSAVFVLFFGVGWGWLGELGCLSGQLYVCDQRWELIGLGRDEMSFQMSCPS